MSNSLGEALKSALAKQWASDDEAHNKMEGKGKKLFAPTNNVTRATFDEVRNNPATRSVIIKRLTSLGYKDNSVSSIITQMVKQGMVTVSSDGRLHTTIPEYIPLKPWRHVKQMAKPKIVLTKRERRAVKEEKPVKEKKPMREDRRPVSISSSTWAVDDVLTQLNILQGRAVYDALHKIFGGAQ